MWRSLHNPRPAWLGTASRESPVNWGKLGLVKNTLLALFLVVSIFTPFCASAIQFDSPSRVLLDATIEGGSLVTQETDDSELREEIGEQLHFIEGQLERETATPQLFHKMEITLGDRTEEDGRLVQKYRADFQVAWTSAKPFPSQFKLVLPEGGDDDLLTRFEAKYRATCANNLGAPFVVPFWYQFDPMRCDLAKSAKSELAVTVTMALAKHATNSEGKSPEYQKIWEDGRLVVAYVAGNYDTLDHGGAAALEGQFTALYGKPLSSTKKSGKNFAIYETEYNTASGKLQIFGVDLIQGNVQDLDPALLEEYDRIQEVADVVAYNGHAGLGANVQALSALAKFAPKRYYLYWFNACKPYAYINSPLFDAMEAANPDVAVSKYLDVMSMAGVGYFSGGRDVVELAQRLVGKQATFRQLMQNLGVGDPVVYHEEDNAWPQPFVD